MDWGAESRVEKVFFTGSRAEGTWIPKVCKIMAFGTVVGGFGLSF